MTESRVPERVSDVLGRLVEQGLRRHAPGERLLWECCPLVAQRPGTPSPDVVSHVVTVWAKGALLGQWDSVSFTAQNAHNLDEAAIDGVVRDMVEELRRKRSADLSQANGGPVPQVPRPQP